VGNLLVLVPVGDEQVPLPAGRVAGDEERLVKPPEVLLKPLEGLPRVVFKRPDRGGDEAFVVEANPVVVDVGPQSDERQPGADRQGGDHLGREEVRFDRADSRHY
jgi:hypothetical protein